jgi:K+-transporting ATPase A subunit
MEPVIFGQNFVQTASSFTISKADLTAFGLTATANNKQEELLAALVLMLKAQRTQAAWSTDTNANFFVTEDQPTLTSRTIGTDTTSFYTHIFNFNFASNVPLSPGNM